MFNSELDFENINLIKTSLTGHYLFKDMNEKIMYNVINKDLWLYKI